MDAGRFARSPARVFAMFVFAPLAYDAWWIWQLGRMSQRAKFPRSESPFWLFIPVCSWFVLVWIFHDLAARLRHHRLASFTPLGALGLLILSNVLSFVGILPDAIGLAFFFASGMALAIMDRGVQDAANRYLQAEYGATLNEISTGEAVAIALGVALFVGHVGLTLLVIGTSHPTQIAAGVVPQVIITPLPMPTPSPILAIAPSAPVPPWGFTFTSGAGDYIGQGSAKSFAPPLAHIQVPLVNASQDEVNLRIDGPADESWTVDLASPRGQKLTVGTYANAERAPFRADGMPGVAISGDGRGCNQVFGSFTISRIWVDTYGNLVALQATFEQHCEVKTAPALRGTISYGAP